MGADLVARVSAPSRLHLGLVDLGHATPRTYGGFGLMIDDPGVSVVGVLSNSVSVTGDLEPAVREVLQRTVEDFCREQGVPGCGISVASQPIAHAGLGRGTTLRLAALVCAAATNEIAIDPESLQRYSGRGGTSGVGINGFFTGGFIVDAGHRGQLDWAPSSQTRPERVPPVTSRIEIAREWHVTLVLDGEQGLSGTPESSFFEAHTPVRSADVLEQMSLLYHGILPSLIERDLVAAGEHYAQFSRLGFKSSEIKASPSSSGLIADLSALAPFVGMSSLGPCVFAISEQSILTEVAAILPATWSVLETRANNEGYRIYA